MEATKEKSPEGETQGFQAGTRKTTKESFSQPAGSVNGSRFQELLAQQGIYPTKPRSLVRCIFHPEKTPSLSIDTERGLFHCFGCGKGGGVKAFALAVGEPWGRERHNSRARARFAVQARRRQAEEQARVILQGRKDTQDDTLWAAWCEANTEATQAADLLGLFFRRPDLAEAFPNLAARAESEYSEALFEKMVLEQRFAGEVIQ
jgi:hypothetical protein